MVLAAWDRGWSVGTECFAEVFGCLFATYTCPLEVDEDPRPGRDAQAVDNCGEPVGCDGWEGAEREAAAVDGSQVGASGGSF